MKRELIMGWVEAPFLARGAASPSNRDNVEVKLVVIPRRVSLIIFILLCMKMYLTSKKEMTVIRRGSFRPPSRG
jgi:hypothetical protein